MSNRTSIRNAIVDLLKTELSEDNSTIYHTNIRNAVFKQTIHPSDVKVYPSFSVNLGPETTEYQSSGFRWQFLTMYFRGFVKSTNEPQELLEELIEDIKTFIDRNEDIAYNVRNPDGTTTQKTAAEMTITSTSTDEGVFSPFGICEVAVTVRYDERNARF